MTTHRTEEKPMSTEEMVKQVAQAVEHEGNSAAVFGTPVKLDNKVVIPVAAVKLGAGGGGFSPEGDNSKLKRLFGGGGGGALDVRPVGFIHESNNQVVYTPIHLDVRDKPFLNEMATGIGHLFQAVSGVGEAWLKKMAVKQEPKMR